MNPRLRLVLTLHNHQPVGNFDDVFEHALADGYLPFLDVLADYPELPVALHVSGSLLEWLVAGHRAYIERIREFVSQGQIELLGGAFYEPILAGIPRRDRIGQIAAYSKTLHEVFATQVRGMWTPERVWEQSFASDIHAAGIEFTILDDFHFRNAGLTAEELDGYYVTEDEGRLLKVFPGDETLRYTIPFREPQETIDHLRAVYDRRPHSVVLFGDDGEKFGVWPGTKEHCYEDGWLRRFFDLLRQNSEWLQVTTPSEAIDNLPPRGRVYLPDASYREMTEWALPAERQAECSRLVEAHQHDADWPLMQSQMRGGFWRNFRTKYTEVGEMYARMLQVSQKLEAAESRPDAAEHRETLSLARTELYRGQCNCSYWHGAFGGLYLPHLRNAVYRHLISADTLLETAAGRTGRFVEVDADDFDLDARQEVRLAGDRLVAFLAPARGGHLYELDVRPARVNLLATLNRRPEAYHDTIRRLATEQSGDGQPFDRELTFKQADLDQRIVYDAWPRKSLVDHFLRPDASFDDFRAGAGSIADFANGTYETKLRRGEGQGGVAMSRTARLGPYEVTVAKTVSLSAERGGDLVVDYELEGLPGGVPVHFAVEFNFAALAAGAPDRYYYAADGRRLGQLETVQSLDETDRLGLVDEWLGVDAALESSRPAGFWTFPIETISQSEGGYELVHQSCCVVPHWRFTPDDTGRFRVTLTLSVDASAAHARQLGAQAALAMVGA